MSIWTGFSTTLGGALGFTTGGISVLVDGVTVTINGSNQLVASGGGGGVGTLTQVLTAGNNGGGLNFTNVGTGSFNTGVNVGTGAANVEYALLGATTSGGYWATNGTGMVLSSNRNPSGGAFLNTANGACAVAFGTLTTGGQITLQTSATPNSVPVNSLRVATSGNTLLGTVTDNNTDKLQVNGTASINGAVKSLSLAVNGLTVVDASNDLFYPDGTTQLTGNSPNTLLYPDGFASTIAQGGTLFYANNGGAGSIFADSNGVWFNVDSLAGSPTANPVADATDGHIYSLQALAPAITGGTGVTASVAGTDQAMTITLTIATTATGTLATVTFNTTWTSAIIGARAPVLSGFLPRSANALTLLAGIYVSSVSSTQFVVTAPGVISSGTYVFSLLVLG